MTEISNADAFGLSCYYEKDDPSKPYCNLAKSVILTAIKDYNHAISRLKVAKRRVDKAKAEGLRDECKRFLCNHSLWHDLLHVRPLREQDLKRLADINMNHFTRSDT